MCPEATEDKKGHKEKGEREKGKNNGREEKACQSSPVLLKLIMNLPVMLFSPPFIPF